MKAWIEYVALVDVETHVTVARIYEKELAEQIVKLLGTARYRLFRAGEWVNDE